MNTAIIVAAGSGQRFDAARPKQFANLRGKPVIAHTLDKFENCPLVDAIILVLSGSGRNEFERSISKSAFSKLGQIVIGGSTRAESVRNGLRAVDQDAANIIAVHDGARPLVTSDEIARTIEAADLSGAACLVADITDTVKEVADKSIVRTVERKQLRRALTPQAFRYDILRRAVENSSLDESITDECSMVEQLGIDIRTVDGDQRNLKITRHVDLIIAEALLRSQDRSAE